MLIPAFLLLDIIESSITHLSNWITFEELGDFWLRSVFDPLYEEVFPDDVIDSDFHPLITSLIKFLSSGIIFSGDSYWANNLKFGLLFEKKK